VAAAEAVLRRRRHVGEAHAGAHRSVRGDRRGEPVCPVAGATPGARSARDAAGHGDHADRRGDFLAVRRAALLAHRTQIDPEGAWMRIPDDALRKAFPWDEYELAQSRVENHVPEGEMERDLFAGIR
jgi:LmbE family N-acetylglucosaminyl deacetylase